MKSMTAEEERKHIIANGGRPIEVHCGICGEKHYQGIGCYPLRKVGGYELFCCKPCYDGNWDGWNSSREGVLLARLKELGIKPPPRNEDGLLPFQF